MKFYLPILLFLASPRIVPYSGGSVVVSGGGGTTYTGTAPIDVTGTNISCTEATGSVSGCVNATDQTFGGNKVFNGLVQQLNAFPRNIGGESVNVSEINYYGVMVGTGPIVPTYDDEGITLTGRRSNTSTAVSVGVRNAYFRDAGSYFGVNSGLPCDTPLFGVNSNGDVVVTAAPNPDCTNAVDILNRGAFTDGTAASGHVMMKSYPKGYITVRGDLAANHDGVLADGGRPIADGGYWIRTESDGGTYFAYSGLHGGLSVVTPEAQWGGWLFELRNNGATGEASRFYVDSWGGIGQNHQLALSNFPACPGFGVVTSLGQFSYGASTGVLMSDTNSGRWYQCTASGWSMMAQQAPVYLPPVLVNAALTVSTLGGFVLPSGYDPTVNALTFYVGASGTGGSTNATIRLSDGTLQCDFAFACNASTGAKRIAGSGAGCGSFTAGSTFTLSVVSIGDCAVGPTLTGNATVEALWR